MTRAAGFVVDGYPTLRGSQASANESAPVFTPGAIFVHYNGTEWALVKYIQMDNSGCSQGEVLITNLATLTSYSMSKSSTDDMYSRPFRGLARATISSQYFGFMVMAGYCERADISMTVASGDFLALSGSTAGKLTGLQASPHAIAVARTAIATGVGSVSLIGTWG